MMARRSLLGLIAAAVGAFGLAGFGESRFSYRYRLTLDVETPEGVKKGSGVLEVRAFDTTNQIGRIDSARGGATTVGESVVVDLGSRGLLFVLLTGRGTRPYADELSANAAARAGGFKIGPGLYTDFARRVAQPRGEIEVLPEELPMLVRFRDVNDPKSVELVDPNDLAKSFGPGVSLKRATIEMTSDPITMGIEKKLGWVPNLRGSIATLAGLNLPYMHLLNQINDGSFWLGIR